MKTKIMAVLVAVIASLGWNVKAQIYDTNDDVVQIFAGSGTAGLLNAKGALAMFNTPQLVVADTFSNLFVWDKNNLLIRKITPDGTVSTFASVGTIGGMAIDGNNTLWMASNGGIYEVGSNGSVTFLTYSGVNGGICTDPANNIYYTAGNQVFRISAQGVLTVWAGNGSSGSTDANGIYASFSFNAGYGPALTADQAGNIYVWDIGNRLIRRIDSSRNVTTIAGNGSGADTDGVGLNASFANIYSMYGDNQGNIIMACGTSIRKMSASTNVVTMAGSFSQNSYANGAGSLARFSGAYGVCASQGMLFVADSGNQRIRQISFNPQPQLVSGANLLLNTYPGLTINGLVGRTYQIQSSPDLKSWNTVTTLLLTSTPYLWFDVNAMNGRKFYRAYLLP